jgi:hypothetical protein
MTHRLEPGGQSVLLLTSGMRSVTTPVTNRIQEAFDRGTKTFDRKPIDIGDHEQ